MPPPRRQKKNPDIVEERTGDSPLPSLPAPAASDESDLDGDALPAVGKVWDEGPKRSLSEIMASSNRPRQANTPQPLATPAGLPADLAGFWSQFLEQVQQQLGTSPHVPLLSGEPRRDGEKLIIRFAGPFASMVKYLEKYRDQMQTIASSIARESLLLQLEADESAPPRPPIAQPRPAQQAQQPRPGQPNLTQVAVREGIPLTPELRAQLEKDPLIRAVMEALDGNIVKVEQSESPKNV